MKTLKLSFVASFIIMGALLHGCGQGGGNNSNGPEATLPPSEGPKPTPNPKPTPTPGPKSNLSIGVNIHLDSGPGVRLMHEMRAGWVRIDMNWSIMEPQRGQWNFQIFDDVIRNARNNGLKVYASLGYSPTWATTGGSEGDVPEAGDWQNFVRTAVTRYHDQVEAFGIWNEPNLGQFWNGTAAQYADVLLKPACQVIRGINRSIKIAGPDLSHLYKPTIDVGDFLYTLKQKDAYSCLDIITHHIYAGGDFDKKINGFSFLGIVYKPGVKQWFERAGIWGRKTWITEFGHDINGMSEDDQAKWVVDNIRVMSKYDWIERAFIFEMTDDPRPTAPYHFGVTRADLSIRPVYWAIKNFIETNLVPHD